MKVVLTAAAVGDLDKIQDYISRDNPLRAASFVAELIDRARSLASYPERFPLVPRYAHLGVRRCGYRAYLIFHRVETQRIVILHILHGASDYEPLLFPDE